MSYNEFFNTKTKDTDRRKKKRDNCKRYVETGINRNVNIRFLLDNLIAMGCKPPEHFIQCIDCGGRQAAGGFGVIEIIPEDKKINVQNFNGVMENNQCKYTLQSTIGDNCSSHHNKKIIPGIFLCENNLKSEMHTHQSMSHEIIHAIDFCRSKMDPVNNCLHIACTEIRAENLSGECDFINEFTNGQIKRFASHGKECVKRRAILSVMSVPKCSRSASEFVKAAFDRCYEDTFPYDRHPNLK